MSSRRILLKTIAGVAAAAMLPAWAQDSFPSHPILIVHGSKPGAPQDVMLRVLAKQMADVVHQGVDVQGRPGGTGQAAMGFMLGQPANGYTIFSDATGITSVLQLPGASFKWTQLQPVYRMQLDPFALYAKQGKYSSLKQFFEVAKSHPGTLRVGGYGVGSPHQITMLLLAREANAKITWVPYDSGSKAIAAVLGGNIDAAMSNISVYRSFKGKAQVLGISAGERVKLFGDVPTFKEQGYDMVRYHWRGMFVRKGTPAPIVEALHKAVGEAVKSAPFQKYLADTATLDGTMTTAEFEELLEKQAKDDLVVLKQLGMVK